MPENMWFTLVSAICIEIWDVLSSGSAKSEDAVESEDSRETLKVDENEAAIEPTPETDGDDSESKLEVDQDENTTEGDQTTLSYDQLKAKSENPVTGIDFKRREVCFYTITYIFLVIPLPQH